jgi:NodT family efflux transporter outer membrane factor (OMF) lipoprotein
MKRILISALLTAVLAGCTVGPDYHPPHPAAPTQWHEPLRGGETNTAVAAADWWRVFHDPELDSLMARAATTNLDLQLAEARVREARAARTIAGAGKWPTLDANGSYSRLRYSKNGPMPFPPGVPLDYDVFQTGFDAAWELDVFGGVRRRTESAAASLGAAEYGREFVRVSLFAEVARNYLEVRALQDRLRITQENIKAQTDALSLSQDRFRNGLTSDLDVQQAASLLATTRAQVPALHSQLQAAMHSLDVLLAQPPGALEAELSAEAPMPPLPPAVPVGLPSDLLQRRPDVWQAERSLAAATADIGVATADLFPKFSLTGSAGLQSISASDWFDAGSRFWSAGPTVQWRVFDAGRIRANIRVQNARQEQALVRYEQTTLNAFKEVEDALVAYANEQVRHRSLADAAKANREAVHLANQLYASGLASFLNVLDAQRSLYQSEDELAQSERDVALDLVALYKALGGGWQPQPPPPQSAMRGDKQ